MISKRKKRQLSGLWKATLLFYAFLFFFALQNYAFAKETGEEDNFFVNEDYDFYGRSDVDAFLAAKSENAYFYFENKYYAELTETQKADFKNKIDSLTREFDKTIYPETQRIFGEEWNPGIDGDSKIIIAFVRLQYNVGGYFNPTDEYSKDRISNGRSNEHEIIYLNPDFLKSGKVEGFLSHEFQHMIYWNEKTRKSGVVDDVWLNEARSELASSIIEDELGKAFKDQTLSVRKKDFLVNYTDSIVDWNNANYDYSSISLFMQYMRDHFGTDIFEDMDATDKKGIQNLDYVLEQDKNIGLKNVFTNWTIANYVNDAGLDSRYGYINSNLKNNFNISPTLIYDKDGNGTIHLTKEIKNWSGDYYEADLNSVHGSFDMEINFDGDDGGSFTLPFIVNYADGSKKIYSVSLDSDQNGTRHMFFEDGKADSIVFIPSSQKTEALSSDNQVKSYGFSMDIDFNSEKNEVLSDGTLIKTNGNNKVYLIENGKKRWITSSLAFISNGFSWSDITMINDEEMGLYPNGTDVDIKNLPVADNSLVKGSNPQVYLIEESKRRWIRDEQAFMAYNFDWTKIVTISDLELLSYPEGEILSKSMFPDGTLIKGPDPKVYLIEDGKKRWITSLSVFNKNRFKWSSVAEVPKEIVASYADGPNID